MTGNSGCNGFGGTYTVEDNQVTFKDVVSTLMACDDPRMAQEDAVRQVLTDTAAFKIDGNTLTLTNADALRICKSLTSCAVIASGKEQNALAKTWFL